MTTNHLCGLAMAGSFAFGGLATTVRAQIVHGLVLDSISGHPVESFTVALLDADDRVVARALARGGRYAIRAPSPGRYRVRVQRIGYRTTIGESVELRASARIEQTLIAASVPISLATVRVDARRACRASRARTIEGERSADAVMLWAEVRKALEANRLAQAEGGMQVLVRERVRAYHPRTKRSLRDSSTERQGSSARPYRSRPAAELADHGYVRTEGPYLHFFAPDAEVLLSDEFVATHCLSVVAAANDVPWLVGLAFEPVRGRSVPDIAGTFWVNRRSAALCRLEFAYTGLPHVGGGAPLGGSVNFEAVPGGGWLVRDWVVRAPVYQTVARPTLVSSGRIGAPRVEARQEVVLAAIHEEGGEILTAESEAGVVFWDGDAAVDEPIRDESGIPVRCGR